jgi:hypothetical protein
MNHLLLIGGGIWLVGAVWWLAFCASARITGHQYDRLTREETERRRQCR